MLAASGDPVKGQSGRGCDDILLKSVYSTLFLDTLKLRNFQNESIMKQTVDVLCGYVLYSGIGAHERRLMARFAYSA